MYLMIKLSHVVALSLCFQVCVCSEAIVDPGIIINQVDRVVDLSSQIIKVEAKFEVYNSGKNPCSQFVFVVEPHFTEKVSFVHSVVATEKLDINEGVLLGNKVWVVLLKKPLAANDKVSLKVKYAITESVIPYPSQIKQHERQLVKYSGNSHIYSPYPIKSCITSIELKTKRTEDYTKITPTIQENTRIFYGPYSDVKQFTISPIEVHYENNSPFLIVDKLIRSVEVSHWGNVAVEEEVSMIHTGAKLKGSFSRYDYQRDPMSGMSSVRAFKTVLPKQASDIYYRDEIGNISTSSISHYENQVAVEIRPRFPLFGGWGTQYKLGYNLPSSAVISKKNEKYALKLDVVSSLYENMVIRELVVKVILPEGSKNFIFNSPYNVERLEDGLHFTYLDIIGRPVISFKKNNVVDYHVQKFTLVYTYPTAYIFLEPLLLVSFILILLTTVIIYVRLDFSLTKNEATEYRMKISGICDKILYLQDSRNGIYKAIEEKLNAFKYDKNLSSFLASLKNLNSEHKMYTSQISDLIAQLKGDATDLADKANELQKLDKQLKEIFTQQQNLYTDKLTPGKVPKTAFGEIDAALSKKKEECMDRMLKVIKSME